MLSFLLFDLTCKLRRRDMSALVVGDGGVTTPAFGDQYRGERRALGVAASLPCTRLWVMRV